MTLPATTPQPIAGSGSGKPEAYHLQFLQAEERATATLIGYFEDARLELEEFIAHGNLTASDSKFYRQLLDETNRIASQVQGLATEWTSTVIPEAHSAGWRTHSTTVVNRGALEALSRSTLGLLTQTTDGIRQAVRQTIAQGILQGLSGADVRKRILQTGLTNIPHWPTVEYRAGVIARTETMGAYNAGALDGMVANGARFVRWIASPDEATCKICLPRDNVVFRIGAFEDFPGDPYPSAQPLPHLPAHPRCRCTIRAEYRGPDGQVIRQNVADQAPKLPSDAMGGDMPAKLPPSIGEIEAAVEARWNAVQREVDAISNRMLGLTEGETIEYLKAVGGHFDKFGHLVIDGPPPRAPSGGDLAGFENRAKTLASYLRKVTGLFKIPPGTTMSATEAANSIGDLLRYTTRFNDDVFVDDVLTMSRRMKAAGYKITKWKPSWDPDAAYKGLNTNWISPDGTVFEMQFHTPTSFQTKEVNHAEYEAQRELSPSDPRFDELARSMAERAAAVKQPPGWDRLLRQP